MIPTIFAPLLLALVVIAGAPNVDTHLAAPAVTPVRSAPEDSGSSGAVGAPAMAVQGPATFYPTCAHCAAAGPAVARMMGGGYRYLGKWVKVSRGGRSVLVKLVTSCGCTPKHAPQRIIDLSPWAFSQLGPLSRGVMQVVVEPVDVPSLPATDTDG